MSETVDPQLDTYVKAILGKKAERLVVLDLSKLSSMADAFIICSGSSHRQVTAIAEHIQRDLKKEGIRPLHLEGRKEGHWVLMDYGSVVIHVFHEPVRQFYDLESLWIDAGRIVTPSMETVTETIAPRKDLENAST
jgi:ribosome-associated protein